MIEAVRIHRNGVHLHARVTGSGPWLVLLHGWPLDHRVFEPQFEAFSARFRLLVPDRRGFGESTGTPDPGAEADDLAALLEHVGAHRACVMGMSQGARIALRFAVGAPERVERLVLQGVAVDGLHTEARDEERIPLADYRAMAQRGDLDAVRDAWLDHPMMDVGGDAALRSRLQAMMSGWRGGDLLGGGASASGSTPGAGGCDPQARVSRLRMPLLVVSGEHETVERLAHARWLARHVPGANEIVLAGCGHLCNLVSPDAFNAAVLDFLAV